jgi:type VI secretion system protein VasD
MVSLNQVSSLAILSALALSCGSSPPPAPAAPAKPCKALPLTLAFTATARSNALASGEGRPVQLRVYQLKSDAKLRTASFEDVWQNDAKTLEGEVVASEQQTIFPDERKTVTLNPKPDAAYLAVVALFREPQGKDWFVVYEIAPPKTEPPCETKADPIPIWLDRMQIQDGAGREGDGEGSSPPSEAKGP